LQLLNGLCVVECSLGRSAVFLDAVDGVAYAALGNNIAMVHTKQVISQLT
jgi:hypothetical protein